VRQKGKRDLAGVGTEGGGGLFGESDADENSHDRHREELSDAHDHTISLIRNDFGCGPINGECCEVSGQQSIGNDNARTLSQQHNLTCSNTAIPTRGWRGHRSDHGREWEVTLFTLFEQLNWLQVKGISDSEQVLILSDRIKERGIFFEAQELVCRGFLSLNGAGSTNFLFKSC